MCRICQNVQGLDDRSNVGPSTKEGEQPVVMALVLMD